MKKKIISYQEYGIMISTLSEMIKESKEKFDYIIGIERGGLPVAVHLSHSLNLNFNSEHIIINAKEGCSILIVDDIVDGGTTLQSWFENLDYNFKHNLIITTASLYWKKHSIVKPDFYVLETEDWIVFPWEEVDEKPNREKYEHLG